VLYHEINKILVDCLLMANCIGHEYQELLLMSNQLFFCSLDYIILLPYARDAKPVRFFKGGLFIDLGNHQLYNLLIKLFFCSLSKRTTLAGAARLQVTC
jgi:hypothetical protein